MTFWRLVTILVASAVASGAPPTGAAAPDVELRRVPNGGIQPEVLVDSSGVLHMLYFSGEPRAGDLFYVRSGDHGATFTAPVRVNAHPGSAIAAGTIRGGHLAVGTDSRVHVVWNGSDAAIPKGPSHRATGRPGMPLLYARSNPAGAAFEPERNLMRRTWALDGGASVTADGSGTVFVVWHAQPPDDATGGEGTRRLWIVRSIDDGATFEEERAVWDRPTGACACCGVRAFRASSGQLLVMYRSATEMVNRDVHVLASTDGARTFTGAPIHSWTISSCPMTSMSFAEAAGRVFGAWETAGNVHFGALDGTQAVDPFAPSTPSSSGRKHPRLAASDRDLLLVWSEGTAWARGGSAGWQRFDLNGRPIGEPQVRAGIPAWSFASAVRRPGGYTIFY